MFPQEPLVVRVMREHKDAILAGEDRAMAEMAGQWLRLEQMLDAQIAELAREVADLAAKKQLPSQAQLMRMERYKKLIFQLRAESGKYAQWADGFVTTYQGQLAEKGLTHAAEAIKAAFADAGGIGAHFDVLHVNAIEAMIGLAGDGSPLAKYLRQIHGEAANGITQALIDGVTMGIHPTKIAEMMRDGLGMGLQTAMNTARTESLRAYRQASLMQYDASGVVSGYKRISAHDERVCAGCLFTEGEIYSDLSQFSEHNQGRCTAVPVLEGISEPNWITGQDWFVQQDESTQASILGPGRFEAWKNGASLDQMVTRIEDPTWGGAFVPTPVGELGQ